MASLTGLTTFGTVLVVVLGAAFILCFLVLLGSFLFFSENARFRIHRDEAQRRPAAQQKRDGSPQA